MSSDLLLLLMCGDSGTIYGVFVERQPWNYSLYFAFGAMVSSGVPPPKCEGEPNSCEVGVLRASFVCIYIIVGIPLFALFLTQVGSYFAERAIRVHEMHVLHRPLSQSEFQYSDVLRAARGSKRIVVDDGTVGQPLRTVTLSLSDFIVLELLRLKRMSPEELEDIKGIFDSIPGSSEQIEPVPSASGAGIVSNQYVPQYDSAVAGSRRGAHVDQRTLAAFNDLVVGIRRARSQSSAVQYVADQLASAGKDEDIALLGRNRQASGNYGSASCEFESSGNSTNSRSSSFRVRSSSSTKGGALETVMEHEVP
jgi:hypothetical protein